tara:strand:+ start:987 stop:1427 length:441 start_codon:yes stop_codon:yes gene_type:complete
MVAAKAATSHWYLYIHSRDAGISFWNMTGQLEQFAVCYAFWKVKLMPNTSKSANALAYCLGMEDVVHASIMLGRIRKGDNNTRQLHLYPWEISAWNGRPSGICPLMGKSDPNYTANKTMCVYLHEILFVPICHDVAQKFQVCAFCL